MASEESKVYLVCGWWRWKKEGKQQEHPGPSIPASCCQPDFLGPCLLSTALTVLMCATEGSVYLKAECCKGSPLRAGWLSSLALSVKGRPDAGWEVSAVDRGTAC